MNLRLCLLAAIVLPLAACAQSVGAPDSRAPAAATAAAAAATAAVPAGDPRVALAAKIPGTRPEDLRTTPVPGIFELAHGGEVSYVTADAGYVFSGDLFKVTADGDFPNLSEDRRRELRLARLNSVPDAEMLVFAPAKWKHTVTVFTDIDCPWCERLHAQMAEYNKLGIRVRYMYFPRTGPDTESWFKAQSAACAQDPRDAFTRAMRGEKLPEKRCAKDHVERDYLLGREVGVRATPGIVLESGELVPGYLTPPRLLAYIQGSKDVEAQSE